MNGIFSLPQAEIPPFAHIGVQGAEFCAYLSIPQVARKFLQKIVIFNKFVLDK